MKGFFAPRQPFSAAKGRRFSITVHDQVEELSVLLDVDDLGECERLLKASNYSIEHACAIFFDSRAASAVDPQPASSFDSRAASAVEPQPLTAEPQPAASGSSAKRPRLVAAAPHAQPNALDILTMAARAPRRYEVFALRRDCHDRLSWDWSVGREGESTPWAWTGEIDVKEPGEAKATRLRLCSNISPSASLDASINHVLGCTRTRSGMSVSYLKSSLQKNIRRRRAAAAVRVALELAAEDWLGLVRRLCVIILEDALLHPAFPILVWLMLVGSKFDYAAPPALVEVVLTITEECATTTLHDDAVNSNENDAKPKGRRFPDDLGSCCDAALIRSLVVRAEYGGMGCDVAMLNRSVSLWYSRLKDDGTAPPVPLHLETPRKVTLPTSVAPSAAFWYLSPEFVGDCMASPWMAFVMREYDLAMRAKENGGRAEVPQGGRRLGARGIAGPLRRSDVCTASIDFHVWPELTGPAIVSHLAASAAPELCATAEALVEAGKDLRQRAMWHCSSGVNFRRFITSGVPHASLAHQDPVLKDIWSMMAPAHHELVMRRLARFSLA